MKIGIDAREIQNEITGIGRYLLNFLEGALARRDDHEYYLYYHAPPHKPFNHPKVKSSVLKGWGTFLWDQYRLPMALKRDRVDLFFSPYYKRPVFLSCPSMITVHDLGPLYVPQYENLSGRFYRGYFRWLVRLSVKRASLVLVVSEYSRNCLQQFCHIPESRIRVVYPDLSKACVEIKDGGLLEEVKKRFYIQGRYIFYAGNLNPHKNLKTLIAAYAGLGRSLQDEYLLVITGSKNKYYHGLQRLAAKHRLNGRVIFTGHVTDRELVSLYSAADLFVFPSLYEGFGFPPLEAMACGTPVVCSDAASIREVVGDAGILVSPADVDGMSASMGKILLDGQMRDDLIRKGFQRVEQFRSRSAAEEILGLVPSVVARELK